MSKYIYKIVILFTVFCSIASANEVGRTTTAFESIIWKGVPLKVHLKAGNESILRFQERVQIGLPPDMVGMFAVESVSNTVYITPLSDFKETRVRFKLLDTNSVLLFDIKASDKGDTMMVDVVNGLQIEAQAKNIQDQTTPDEVEEQYDYVDLARYAFQNIYSPERLIKPLSGVSEKTISDESAVKNIVSGFDVDAIPASQWKTNDGLFVTAVYLQNRDAHKVRLDPRRMRNSSHWLATALYSNVLSPSLVVGDVTTMVVISDREWEDSISWLR